MRKLTRELPGRQLMRKLTRELPGRQPMRRLTREQQPRKRSWQLMFRRPEKKIMLALNQHKISRKPHRGPTSERLRQTGVLVRSWQPKGQSWRQKRTAAFSSRKLPYLVQTLVVFAATRSDSNIM